VPPLARVPDSAWPVTRCALRDSRRAPFVMSSSSYCSATKARYKPNIRWQGWAAGFIIVTHEF